MGGSWSFLGGNYAPSVPIGLDGTGMLFPPSILYIYHSLPPHTLNKSDANIELCIAHLFLQISVKFRFIQPSSHSIASLPYVPSLVTCLSSFLRFFSPLPAHLLCALSSSPSDAGRVRRSAGRGAGLGSEPQAKGLLRHVRV